MAQGTTPTPADAMSVAAQAVSEAAEVGKKMLTGTRMLDRLRDQDVQIATTPKDQVWQQDKVTLYRYRPLAEPTVKTPVLITYGLVGRWTMTDLQDDRSLVQNLLRLGMDLYVVDWGNPSRADRYLTLDDYICGYLDGCVSEMCRRAGVDKVNLLGVCEGGAFTVCYAALEPERVNTLTLTITPVDFHADTLEDRPGHGFINLWTRSLTPEDIDRMIEANGNLPGEFMGAVFNQMTPVRNLTKYNVDLLDVVDDEKKLLNWLRMEKWIADRPDHPGEAAKQWLKDLYQQNKLVKGELELDGRRVDLSHITMPVLNVYAKDDHIIPPATSRALAGKVGTKEYEELGLPGGHVGVFVGGKSQKLFAPAVAKFLKGNERQTGHGRSAEAGEASGGEMPRADAAPVAPPSPTPRDAPPTATPPAKPARAKPARAKPARAAAPQAEPARSEPARSDPARPGVERTRRRVKQSSSGQSSPGTDQPPPRTKRASAEAAQGHPSPGAEPARSETPRKAGKSKADKPKSDKPKTAKPTAKRGKAGTAPV